MNKNTIPSSADVVIAGAGLGGLVCGIELQRHGLNVCIFEKKHIAGGYAHLFKRKDYVFDVSLHHLGGLGEGDMTYKVLQPLGILEKLEYRKKENLFSARYPDFDVNIPNDKSEIIEYLSKMFPHERENIRKYFEVMTVLKKHVTSPVIYGDFSTPPDQLLSYKYIDSTFADLTNEFITDSKLKAVLQQMWNYLGLPPELATANYSACIFASGFIEGAYHVKGGGTAITNALVERFEELGGSIFYRNGVKKIIVENNSVRGVELEKGEYIATKQVVSNASPYDTFFNMMDENVISKVFKTRLNQMEISNSLHAMYIGLKCTPSSIGIPVNNFFYNHQYDYTKAYRDCMSGYTDKTDWCCTNSELEETLIAPQGGGILSFAELTSPGNWLTDSEENYENAKHRLKDILLDKYDACFPGLKENAEVVILGTPRTMKRYSSNPLGAVYGLAQTVQQSNNRRLGNRTPIAGLTLTGSWTQAGGGYEGTMMTGLKSAHVLLNGMQMNWLSLGEYANKKEIKKEPDSLQKEIEKSGYKMYSLPAIVYPDDTNYLGKATETAFLRFFDRGRVALIEQSAELNALKDELSKYFVHVYKFVMDLEDSEGVGKPLSILTGYRKTTSHRASVDQIICNADNKILSKALFEIVFVKIGGELVELPEVYKFYDQLPFTVSKPALPKVLINKNTDFKCISEFYVYYEDTDAQGIVYNVSYTKYCQKTLFNFRKEILGDRDFDRLKTKRIEIRFLNSANMSETILVKALPRTIDENNFVVDFIVENKATKATLTEVSIEYLYK
ncbi:MAG: FAD-dependent oxidoreductase [Bacteroidales bacterium]|nr:FAD-dependent oxidoreductase [Bacteroidales bacterium]